MSGLLGHRQAILMQLNYYAATTHVMERKHYRFNTVTVQHSVTYYLQFSCNQDQPEKVQKIISIK
jgi:hypothetical protein